VLIAKCIELESPPRARPKDIRVLTALDHDVIRLGRLSAQALSALNLAGAQIASIPLLHAKLVIVDQWALVGSGNLTTAGLAAGNIEVFAAVEDQAADAVAEIFDGWWRQVWDHGGQLTTGDLEEALAIAPVGPRESDAKTSGSVLGTPLTSLTAAQARVRALIDHRRPTTAVAGGRPQRVRTRAGDGAGAPPPAAWPDKPDVTRLSEKARALVNAAENAQTYAELRAATLERIDLPPDEFASLVHHYVQGNLALSKHPCAAIFLKGVDDDPAFTREIEKPRALRATYDSLTGHPERSNRDRPR
jgi:hypothetical protein